MRDADRIVNDTLSAQAAMFRLAERDHALTPKRLSLDSGIPLPTLRTKISGTVLLTIAEFNRIAAAGMPDELLSLVTEPGGKDVVTPADDGGDLDELKADAADLVAAGVRAKGPVAVADFARKARLYRSKWARPMAVGA